MDKLKEVLRVSDDSFLSEDRFLTNKHHSAFCILAADVMDFYKPKVVVILMNNLTKDISVERYRVTEGKRVKTLLTEFFYNSDSKSWIDSVITKTLHSDITYKIRDNEVYKLDADEEKTNIIAHLSKAPDILSVLKKALELKKAQDKKLILQAYKCKVTGKDFVLLEKSEADIIIREVYGNEQQFYKFAYHAGTIGYRNEGGKLRYSIRKSGGNGRTEYLAIVRTEVEEFIEKNKSDISDNIENDGQSSGGDDNATRV